MELLSLDLNENEYKELISKIKIITNIGENDINIELLSTNDGCIRIRYFTNSNIDKKENIDKLIGKIAKLIIEYTKFESAEYLKENYFYFEESEFDAIIKTIEEEIEHDIKIQLLIKNKFKEVLENSNNINLNGFIKFRLKFIKLYVAQVVEKCIDSYLMKKEYLDFINIIKYITDVEEQDYDLVNIIYKNNKLQVYDSDMIKLSYVSNVEIAKELDGKVLNYDESVINILLSISPVKIILHASDIDKDDTEANNTVEIIKHIFEGKFEICDGCKYCNLEV